jgi:transposase
VNIIQRRAHRYWFYPTAEQFAALARTFDSARFDYNWALNLRSDERQERVR